MILHHNHFCLHKMCSEEEANTHTHTHTDYASNVYIYKNVYVMYAILSDILDGGLE